MNKQTINWTRRAATVQAGEYVESTITITQLVSADERFTIIRCGTVDRRRANGARGQLIRRFRWTGYRMHDHKADLPKWVSPTARFATVAQAKREAEFRLRRERALDTPQEAQ